MKLETSVELLERIRAKHGSTWYGLGRLLDAHENTIGSWKAGRTIVDRKFAPRIALLLDESPEYVLLCLEHERETSPEVRKIWKRLASLIAPNAASILFGAGLALGLAALPCHEASAASSERAPEVCILSKVAAAWRRLHRWLSALTAQPQGIVTAATV